jgi:hypothetical protein
MTDGKAIFPVDQIENRILLIRGERVVLDTDLAAFYGVTTRRLNEQVKRNRARFPAEFAFLLSAAEKAEVVANCDHLKKLKYSRVLPLAFTEYGAIMAANVLHSTRAVEMGVLVIRAFVNLRRTMASDREFGRKLAQLEERLAGHDQQLLSIVQALKSLLGTKEVPQKRRIGFDHEDN